jgi:hypothetical protein
MTRQVATVVRTHMNDELSSIERDYPAWHIWQSQAGRWWATRLGHARPLATAEVASAGEPEFALTLDADTAAELRQALAGQP